MPEQKSVLIVGVGSIGERHLRCFQKTGRARLALCEVNKELRDRISKQYRIEKAFDNLDTALADLPKCVVIATPAQLHIPMAIKAAEAGVHMLIEKPLSTSSDGIELLMKIVQRKDLVSAVAYVWHCYPAFVQAGKAIHSGRFDEPVEIVMHCGEHFPTYRPIYRDIYYNNRATGGGAVQDAMTHMLNMGEWFVGPVDRLVADIDHKVLDGVEVEDTVHLLTRQGNVMGSYTLNQHQAPSELTMKVVCRKGTVQIEPYNNRWRWMLKPKEPWTDEPIEVLERDDHFIVQANVFLDMVDGNITGWNTLESGLQTLRCNLAILKSAQDGRWHTIDR